MFYKLKVLTLMQLSEKLKVKRGKTQIGTTLGVIGKTFMAMAIAFGIFCGLFYLIFKVLFIPATSNLFIGAIFLLQAISIISCTVGLSQTLYTSKDNMLLLTYPVKHMYVFISKLIVMYILELKKSLILTLPLFLAYAVINNGLFNLNYFFSSIFYSLFLPLMPVLLGAFISIPFVYLSKLFKRAGWVKGAFTLLLFGGLITLCVFVIRWLDTIAPIRIVELFNTFCNGLDEFLSNMNKGALYCHFIANAMLGSDPLQIFLYDLYMVLVIVGTGAISILVAWPTFYHLASSASENATTKVHKSVNVSHSNTFFTFMRKELTLSVRNISNFASDYVFLFAMPVVMLLLAAVFVRMDRNSWGYPLTYGFIGLILLIMLTCSNTATATAISSEGSEFVLLKTAPGDTKNIIWSKLLINFIISFASLLLTYILIIIILRDDLGSGKLDLLKLSVVFLFVLVVDIALLFWSIQLDIVSPKLREFANSQNRAELKNSSTSVLIGMVVSVIFAAILIIINFTNFSTGIAALILLGLALVFVGIRLFFLKQYRDAYFEEIQL